MILEKRLGHITKVPLAEQPHRVEMERVIHAQAPSADVLLTTLGGTGASGVAFDITMPSVLRADGTAAPGTRKRVAGGKHTYHQGAVGLAACKRKAKDYAALKQANYAFVPIAFEMSSGRLADVSQQGLRRVLREQGATEEMVRSVFAGLAAAVVSSQGQYVNQRVAIHLSQQQARSGESRHSDDRGFMVLRGAGGSRKGHRLNRK